MPLVIAGSISVNESLIDRGENSSVGFSVACAGIGIVRIGTTGETGGLVDVQSNDGNFEGIYAAASHGINGTYYVNLYCEDGSRVSETFCVGACSSQEEGGDPGQGVQGNQDPDPEPEQDPEVGGETTPPASSSSSSGGGRGRYCQAKWNCDYWSACGVGNKQSRECRDTSRCRKGVKTETRECSGCTENWECQAWGACTNNLQRRHCIDVNACGSAQLIPEIERSCSAGGGASGALRDLFSSDGSQQTYGGQGTSGSRGVSSTQGKVGEGVVGQVVGFFKDYWPFVAGGVVLVLVLLGVIVVLKKRGERGKAAYNYDDLRGWVAKQRSMGVNDSEIRGILKQNTGWNDGEVNEAFGDLK